MSGPLATGGLVLLVTLAGCAGIAGVIPVPRDDFAAHVRGRAMRMIARAVWVLAVVGVAVGGLGLPPVGVTAGAIAGWLAYTAVETRRLGRGRG
jgi:hypothetical protein